MEKTEKLTGNAVFVFFEEFYFCLKRSFEVFENFTNCKF